MAADPWKISTCALAAAVALAVAGDWVGAAGAQPRPVPIPSPAPPKKDEPPAARAAKVLDKARQTLAKAKPDKAGHRDRAIRFIAVAAQEVKALQPAEEGEAP